jgi:hypothetical protein
MSRFASICAGLLMVSSLSGCCLLGHGCGGGGYAPMGGGYGGGGCSPCQTGACGAMATGYPSAYSPGVPQSAYLAPQVAGYAPQASQQMVMMDTLPTY